MGYSKPGNAVYDVLAERNRQLTAEGFSEAHDDTLTKGELAEGAACYALAATLQYDSEAARPAIMESIRSIWPFEQDMFKPADPRTDLIKACAMLIAEIDRMDRTAKKV